MLGTSGGGRTTIVARIVVALATALGGGLVPAAGIAVGPVPEGERERLRLAPQHVQYVRAAEGIPVVASGRVTPQALAEAAWLLDRMLARRPDVARAIARSPVRFVVMAHDEFATDVPEHADLRPRAHWDRRARGLGATLVRPAVSCGEENLLCFPGDPYATENILIHEFGHVIHEIGLATADPTFEPRLRAAYEAAQEHDRWTNTYARSSLAEYWAEGVQSWFSCNRVNDREHGPVNSPAQVREHDPPLAALLEEVFGPEPWAYVRPHDRAAADRGHVAGFDQATAPAFDWARRTKNHCAAPADIDLTFIVTSDPHYKTDPEWVEANKITIERINRVTDLEWPMKFGGGKIASPRGVLCLGDLIDDGDKPRETPAQWASYTAQFGLDGTDGVLEYPVWELWGNHDGPPVGKEKHGFSVQAKFAERNRQRLEKKMISRLSENGLFCSWDWDGVHFLMLGIYPANEQHPQVRYNRVWHDPQGALDFAKEDLAETVGDSGRPVVLLGHSGFDTDWWHPEDWAAFYDAVDGSNSIAYMFGHTGTGVWGWSPLPEAPKIQCVNTGQTTQGFFVVRITHDHMRAVYHVKDERSKEGDGWAWKFPLDVPISIHAPGGLAAKAAVGAGK